VLLDDRDRGAIDALARHVAQASFELTRWRSCLPTSADGRFTRAARTAGAIEPEQLNHALAQARGALEFDAHRRAYGGQVVSRRQRADSRCATAPNAVGLLAATPRPRCRRPRRGGRRRSRSRSNARSSSTSARPPRSQRQRGELASTLLASLSHDLKTPLTAIRVAVENLRGDLPGRTIDARRRCGDRRAAAPDPPVRETPRHGAHRCRGDSVQREWVTPADVVDAAVAHVRTRSTATRFASTPTPVTWCNIDARLASVALSHLLENAARYSPADRDIVVEAAPGRRTCTVTVDRPGSRARAARARSPVRAVLPRPAGAADGAGTGMGLAITRGLLTAIGGRVVGGEHARRGRAVLDGDSRRDAPARADA
jgi:two-component system sensor histidine kinase KdpD